MTVLPETVHVLCSIYVLHGTAVGMAFSMIFRSTTVRLLQNKLIKSVFNLNFKRFTIWICPEGPLGLQNGHICSVWVMLSRTPAPWVQSDVPSGVAKRLCDASAVAPRTSRLAAEKFGSSRYHNSGSFESQEVILGCFGIYEHRPFVWYSQFWSILYLKKVALHRITPYKQCDTICLQHL